MAREQRQRSRLCMPQLTESLSMPVYRHPADKSPPLLPWSPTVQRIRDAVSSYLNQPLNHALIQHYRHGGDYISEHSDKTIDVVRGSYIVNVSLGAQRTMTLRTKKDAARAQAKATASPPAGGSAQAQNTNTAEGGKAERETQRVPLPHNSVFVMGLKTNEKWLHSIRHDKRPVVQKTPEELAFNGERISLTFRHIGTFLDKDETRIWGQGAKGKTREKAGQVIRSSKETGKMIRAFGLENSRSDFVWERAYGRGFDVLHFT